MASRKFVIFKMGEDDFGIDINQVNIIEKMTGIFKVPNTPDYVEGLINLRGKVHTVFNLRKKFNLPVKEYDDNTKIIIVNTNNLMVGFIVDEVSEILTLEDENFENAPELIVGLNKKFISGIAKNGEKIVMMLDISNILSLADEMAINKM